MTWMTNPRLTTFDLGLLHSFDAAFDRLRAAGLLTPAITMEQLNGVLNTDQKQVVQQILGLNPKSYGVSTPHLGVEPVPTDLVVVSGQKYKYKGGAKVMSDKLVPQPVYDAFVRMDEAFQLEYPGRALLIESAYRSPASQII